MPTNQHNQFGSDHHGEEGKSTINRSNGVVVVVVVVVVVIGRTRYIVLVVVNPIAKSDFRVIAK
jgi:hypothetical protein